MPAQNSDVAIIGGGFAGMATAILLQNHDIKSTIYETREESYTSGGNIALAPNALRVLDHAGVYNTIRTQGYNYDEIDFINNVGHRLGSFKNGSTTLYGYQAIRISRTIVRDALRAQCKARGIDINYGKRCVSVSEDNGRATITFKDGSEAEAAFVIAADGIHSSIRSYVDSSHSQPYYSGVVGLTGHVDAHELEGTERRFGLPAMTFGGDGFFAVMPADYNCEDIGFFATVELPDRSREEWDELGRDGKKLHDYLAKAFLSEKSQSPEYIQELCKKARVDSLACWPFFHAPNLPSWASPSHRIVLIGDAAHAMPPTGGQGAAMALEDAETLAHTLGKGFIALPHETDSQQKDHLSRLVQQWDKHRHERAKDALAFTNKNGNWRKAPANFIEKEMKEWVIWAALQWAGPDGGAGWLYGYSGESILKELV